MKRLNNISSFWKLILCVLFCEAIGITSGLLTQVEMNTWFNTLEKPSWNPPSFVFGPIWTLLYLMMGISLWLVWKSNVEESKKTGAVVLFGIQLFFNFWWSILFFKIHSPFLALIDILLMDITIGLTIFRFLPISRKASWLLVPYLLWVCFATVLNYTIWSMNN